MASISAASVKALRDKTGAGMMDCKRALSEVDGDMEAAVDWLRTKGLATAAKKATRSAAEGLVGVIKSDQGSALMIEVNAETDFVSRSEEFIAFVAGVAKTGLDGEVDDVDSISKLTFPGTDHTVSDELQASISKIGENLVLRRAYFLKSKGTIGRYIHSAVKPGFGRIGVLVSVEAGDGSMPKGDVSDLAHRLAMHIAAAKPDYLSRDQVSEEVLEREQNVLEEKAKESGKPPQVIEKMITGGLEKFFRERCLLMQASMLDEGKTIQNLLDDRGKELGGMLKIGAFVYFQLGEGIEVEKTDFAAEVASAIA